MQGLEGCLGLAPGASLPAALDGPVTPSHTLTAGLTVPPCLCFREQPGPRWEGGWDSTPFGDSLGLGRLRGQEPGQVQRHLSQKGEYCRSVDSRCAGAPLPGALRLDCPRLQAAVEADHQSGARQAWEWHQDWPARKMLGPWGLGQDYYPLQPTLWPGLSPPSPLTCSLFLPPQIPRCQTIPTVLPAEVSAQTSSPSGLVLSFWAVGAWAGCAGHSVDSWGFLLVSLGEFLS